MVLLKLSTKIVASILLLLILGLSFYWYEYRPYKVIKDCHFNERTAVRDKEYNDFIFSMFSYETGYMMCLRSNGISAEPSIVKYVDGSLDIDSNIRGYIDVDDIDGTLDVGL